MSELLQAITAEATQAAVTTEPKVTLEVPVVETQDPELAKRLAHIAKRDRALLDKEAKLKAEYEAKAKELEERYKPAETNAQLIQRLKNKDYKAAEEMGLSYNEWTNLLVNDGNPTPEMIMEQKLLKFKEEFDSKITTKEKEFEAKAEEFKTKEQQERERIFQLDIKDFLVTDSGSTEPKYEWLMSLNDDPEVVVYHYIDQYYKKTLEETGRGRVLKLEEAADAVEKYFEGEAERRFGKVKKAKALLEKLHPTAPKVDVPQGTKPPDATTDDLIKLAMRPSNKTISSSMNPPPSTPSPQVKSRAQMIADMAKTI